MAWDRTALAVAVNGALLVVRDLDAARLSAAVLAFGLALVVVVLGRRRSHEVLRDARAGTAREPRWELRGLTVGVVALGILDLWSVLAA